jgi:predicted enzyme related to lactoylglutathione lyase
MPDTKVLAPGSFCWCDVSATDVAGCKSFYGDLFGWETQETGEGDFRYVMLRRGSLEVGGMYELRPDQREQGVPSHWLAYVLVENVDESAERAQALGGNLVMGPMDVMDVGRTALIQDPTGGVIALWQAKPHGGGGLADGPGTPCWHELTSTDAMEATAFYAALFGWKLQSFLETMDYTLFKNGEQSVGGAMQRTEEMGDAPSHWMTYFAVADCDASVKRVKELGGRLVSGPNDIPQVGRSAMVADPDGAMFTLIRLTPAGDV